MSYAQLRADLTLDTRALENSLQFADNMMRAFTRANYTTRVSLDTKVLQTQVAQMNQLFAGLGKMVVPVTMDVHVNGQAVAIQNLNAIEKQVAAAGKTAESAGAKIAVVHRNIEGMSGTTKLDFNGAKLMQGLEQASARVLKFKQDFGSGAGIGDITGQINKLQTFFSGQGIKADAFNKIIPELQRVLEMQKDIKGNRVIDFEIKVNERGVAQIEKLNLVIDGAKLKADALKRAADATSKASAELKRFDNNISAAAKNSALIGRAMDANAAKTIKAAQGMANAFDGVQNKILQAAKAQEELKAPSEDEGDSGGSLKERIVAVASGIGLYNLLAKASDLFNQSVKEGIGFNAKSQQVLQGFETQLGNNAAAARAFYADIQKLNDASPFTEVDILPAAQQLLAAKIPIKEVKDALRGLNEQVSALGGNGQKYQQIATALTQIALKPRLQLEEITTQMVEAGVDAFEHLSKAYGTNSDKIQEWISKGLIPGKEAFRALTNQMERTNFGSAAKQAQTLSGAFSTLADRTRRALGATFAKSATDLTKFLNTVNAKSVAVLNRLSAFAANKNVQIWLTETQNRAQKLASKLVALGQFLGELGQRVFPFIVAGLAGIAAGFVATGIASTYAFATTIPASIAAGAAAIRRFIVLARTAQVSFAYVPAIILVGVVAAVKGFFLLGNALNNLLDKMPQKVKDFIGFKASDFKDFQADFDRGLDFVVQAGKKKLGEMVSNFLPDTSKLTKAWSEAGTKTGTAFTGKMPPLYVPKLGAPKADDTARKADAAARKIEAVASRAAAAARKMETDRLNDLATAWTNQASAVEKSAARQVAAMQGLKDSFGGLFGDFQSKFLEMGITNNPLGTLIGGLEKMLDLGGKSAKVVADARRQFGTLQGAANAAKSRVEQLQGQDGTVVTKSGELVGGSAAGDRIAAAAVKMQQFTGDYRKRCDALADITVNSITKMFSGIMGPRKGDTAAKTMARFMGAGIGFKPNGSYTAGDIVYTGASKKQSAGHVQVVGPNGNFLDQYGSHARPTTAPQWVVRAGGAAQAQRFATPAIGQKSAGQKLAGFDASGFDLNGITGDLSAIQAIDKGWGRAVKNVEGNVARFAIQSDLAKEKGRAMLNALARAISENKPGVLKSLDEIGAKLGTTFTLKGKGTNAAAGLMRDIGNAIDTQLNAPARAVKIEEASKSLAKLKTGLSDSAFLLREQGKAWRESANDAAKAEKQIAIATERLRLWRDESSPVTQLFKQGDKKGANAAFSQLLKSFVGNYDTEKGVEKIKATNAEIAEQIKAANAALEEQIKLRAEATAKVMNASSETTRANADAVKAMDAQNEALRTEIALRGRGLNETAINNALELRRVYLDKYTASLKQFIAAAIAQGNSPIMALALGTDQASKEASKAVDATRTGQNLNATNDRSKELEEAKNQLAQRRFELENNIGAAAQRQFEWKMKSLPIDENVLAVLRKIDAIPMQEWMKKTQAEGALNRQLNSPFLTKNAKADLQFRADKRDAFTPEQIDLMLPIDRTMRRMQEQSEVFGSIMGDWKSTWNSTWQEIGKTGDFKLGSMLDSMSARLVAFGAETLSNKAWDLLLGLFTSAAVGAVSAPGAGVNLRPSGGSSGVNLRPTGGPGGVNLRPSASFAVGIDRVPRDMTARIHANEMVLNSQEADRYRSQQVAMELARGAARQSAAQSNSGNGRGGSESPYIENANFYNVKTPAEVPKALREQNSGIPLSRRSNAKNLQRAVGSGF